MRSRSFGKYWACWTLVVLVGCSSDEAGSGGVPMEASAGSGGAAVAAGGAAGDGTLGGGAAGEAASPAGAAGSAGAGAGAGGSTTTEPEPEPTLLSETGLYSDIATGTLAADVHFYQPAFALWSDGSTKQRWVYLPPGTQIDTRDMDFWQYPAGTKLWKEFSRDGQRVETRLLWKRAAGDWFMMAFEWNADQSDAVAVPNGQADAGGTMHDIPAQEDCGTCHSAMDDRSLSFTAVELSHDLEGLDLEQVIAMGWLTEPPAGEFSVPGTPVEQAALGYLHANCGMCHNNRSKIYLLEVNIDVWLKTEELAGAVADTASYLSLVEQDTTGDISELPKRVAGGDPEGSAVFELMGLRGDNDRQMPLVGTELVDDTGLAAIESWILGLPPAVE